MSDNFNSIFCDNAFMDVTTPFDHRIDANLAIYKIMDEFPSICELDPTEAFEKKNDRTNACDEAFKNSMSFDDYLGESVFSGRFNFSFKTEDMQRKILVKESSGSKNSPHSNGKIKFNFREEEKKFPEVRRGPQTRGRRSLRNSNKSDLKVKESFSFGNRARFSKKHDREMFHVLQTLCKKAGVDISNFYNPDLELTDELDEILIKLVFETKWRRSRKIELLQRIRRIASDASFSVRDRKLLKTLVMKQIKRGSVNFESLLYYFPGKTVEMLKKQYALEEGPASKRVGSII